LVELQLEVQEIETGASALYSLCPKYKHLLTFPDHV
jgi:hypothetical protein